VAGEIAPAFDFILGDDFFRQVDFEFDYAKGVVRIFQPENSKNSFLGYWDPNAQVLPLLNDRHHLVLPIMINGRGAQATLDSGAASSVVSLAFAESVGITKNSPGMLPGGCSGGMGGAGLRNWVTRFESISVGNETIRDPQLHVQDYSTTDMRQASDMFLGTDFLKSHRVYVARSQDKVYLTYTGGQVFTAAPTLECDQDTASKNPKEAMAARDQAIATNPNDTKALMQRASLRRQGKDLDGARTDLDAVIKLEPTNGVALAMRAAVRAQLKDVDGSLADSEAAIAQGIRTATMYANRGAMLRSKGNCERAIVEYDEALKIDPNLQSAQRGREACLAKKSD
jgi:Flp pilus assembly protein TadD